VTPGGVRTGVWFFPDAPAAVTVDTIAAAEDQGIDEAWLGDEGPARRIIAGRVLDELVVHGPPAVVGKELAARVRALDVTSVGVALLTRDPLGVIGPAATALATARRELG